MQQAYVKASNTDANDWFGVGVALSADGNTLAVGAENEASNATGVDGLQSDNSASYSGAVYVFTRSPGTGWTQQAYLKASNTGPSDGFGVSVSLSADGSTLVVGAYGESSSNGTQSDNAASLSGAVYVFTRVAGAWSQQAYLKASNIGAGDHFGERVSLSADGDTLAVGAFGEDSNATGVNGNQFTNSSVDSGAVYVFVRASGAWTQQAYVKASNTGAGDRFGTSVALNGDGSTLAVGASHESSNAVGINNDEANNLASQSGAAYVFVRVSGSWSQQAYVKASNTTMGDTFGANLALSADGDTLAVGATKEDGGWGNSGAVYVFSRAAGVWAQQAYVKASNFGANDDFGNAVALSADGNTLAVGAPFEDSASQGVNGSQNNDFNTDSGAAYLFTRSSSTWTQRAYFKASNTGGGDGFGGELALSGDGHTLVIDAISEDSAATGINGDQASEAAPTSGAAYVFAY